MIVLLLLLIVVGSALARAERPKLTVLGADYWAGVARQDARGPI